jgi:hypothetical protein
MLFNITEGLRCEKIGANQQYFYKERPYMKKLLSVLLVLALIILPLAAVVTSAASIMTAASVVGMIKDGTSKSTTTPGSNSNDDDPTGSSASQDPTTEAPAVPGDDTTAETPATPGDDTTAETPAGDTTGSEVPVNNTTKPTGGGNNNTTSTTKKADPNAAAVKAYNDAVDKLRASNKNITKKQVTSMGEFSGDDGMIKLTSMNFDRISPGLGTIGKIVKDFLGNGEKTFGPGKASDHIKKSTLTTNDINSATFNGKSLTINIKNKNNPTPGTGALGNVTSDMPYESDVREQIDYNVKESLKGLAKVNIGAMAFNTTNVVLKAEINASGQFTALSLKFDFLARLEKVDIKILGLISLGSGEWGEVKGTRTLTYTGL